MWHDGIRYLDLLSCRSLRLGFCGLKIMLIVCTSLSFTFSGSDKLDKREGFLVGGHPGPDHLAIMYISTELMLS